MMPLRLVIRQGLSSLIPESLSFFTNDIGRPVSDFLVRRVLLSGIGEEDRAGCGQ